MAAYNGFKTSIRIGAAHIVLMDGWNLNTAQGVAQYGSFGTTFKGAFANIKSWTASCKGTADRSATGQTTLFDLMESGGSVSDVALRFYSSTSTTLYWSGNAVLENFSVDSALEDATKVSFSFVGNGPISWST